jgi:hypothetical protein
MSRTDELEREASERRDEQTGKLQHWANELRELAEQLFAEDRANGWHVRYGQLADHGGELMALITIDRKEFARFTRDEAGIIGVLEGGKPVRFANRHDAFDVAVKRRMARDKFSR